MRDGRVEECDGSDCFPIHVALSFAFLLTGCCPGSSLTAAVAMGCVNLLEESSGTMKDEKLKSAVTHLKETVPALLVIYRFGSEAQGTARPGSDIDLAVLAQSRVAPNLLVEVQQGLAMLLHRDVDLIDLRAVSTVMQMQVLSTGECLFSCDDRARELFEMVAYASYARLNEERSGILDDIRRQGSVYAG
jgi:predicted nucleotidyltransferase